MFCFSIQGTGRGSIQFFGELILRTSVWFLKLLRPCSLSVKLSVCPFLINWIPPVSDKCRTGEKSQIKFCKTSWKSVAEQRRATQANALSKRKEERFLLSLLLWPWQSGSSGSSQLAPTRSSFACLGWHRCRGGEGVQPGVRRHHREAASFQLLLQERLLLLNVCVALFTLTCRG